MAIANWYKMKGLELPKETLVVDPDTGGAKGQKEEQYSLIPVWPLSELARCYGFGAGKYAAGNWLKGYSWSLSQDALMRHFEAWRSGESTDPESGLSHLAHLCFHAFALQEFERLGLGKDDRLFSGQQEEEPEQGCEEDLEDLDYLDEEDYEEDYEAAQYCACSFCN